MTLSTYRSLAAAALIGIGVVVAPSLVSARDEPAPIEPANPQTLAVPGDNMPLLSSGGEVITGNAWCDPVTQKCERKHPWDHHKRR